MAEENEKRDCRVADGKFVEPCKALSDEIEWGSPAGAGKGLFKVTYTNMKTGKYSRSMVGIKNKMHPRGLLFNFCPWCGANISSHFQGPDHG